MKTKKETHKKAFTLIELLITVAIIGILILVSLFIFQIYMTRARDGRRKVDLAKLQRVLEDYNNDSLCYPDALDCNGDLDPYIQGALCDDPINSGVNIYYYSVSSEGTCKKWYKIFTSLEYEQDPIIEEIGCNKSGACGPFNYVVTSPNIGDLDSQPGEVPPWPLGIPTFTPTPTNGEETPTDTPTGTVTNTPTLTQTPTPPCPVLFTCVGQGGFCNVTVEGAPGAVCDDTCNSCGAAGCFQPYPACVP